MSSLSLLALLCIFCVSHVFATSGIDISLFQCEDGVSSDEWSCLANSLGGHAFAVIQVWNGGYQLDSSTADCVAGALAAGFAHVDVYVFMCPECGGNGDAGSVINTINSYLKGNNVGFGMLWFDVEQCDGCWADPATNANYLMAGVQTAQGLGLTVGMYSSEYEWSATVGDSMAFDNLPLWYAHYDGDPSFDDSWAYQFGGWSSPAIKQYDGTSVLCGVSVDSDWYPDYATYYNATRSVRVGDMRKSILQKRQQQQQPQEPVVDFG